MFENIFKINEVTGVGSSRADERTMNNLEMDPLYPCHVLVSPSKGRLLERPCSVWTLSLTHSILSSHLGLAVARESSCFCGFLLMHQEPYEKFCFVGISCTILHTKAARKRFSWRGDWNLERIFFPKHIDLGTSAFHPLLFVPSYVLPAWYNLDLFFNEPSLSALECHCVLLKPCQPRQSCNSFARNRFSSSWDLTSGCASAEL